MRRRLRLLYHWVRRRPRLLSRRCGLHAAPRISSETPPGTKASPPAFKGGRSPGRTIACPGTQASPPAKGVRSPCRTIACPGAQASPPAKGGAVSMPHHRSPRRNHWVRRRLARERFGTNRQHPATKKITNNLRARNRNILPPFHPHTSLSLLSVFTAFCPTPYIPAIYSHLLPPC